MTRGIKWHLPIALLLTILLAAAGCAPADDEGEEAGAPCAGATCGTNAHCNAASGKCVCDDGYPDGDPYTGCTQNDLCANVTCGTNAHCVDVTGDCVCDSGYEGNPLTGCTEIDFCEGVTCGTNANCDEDTGDCVCDYGYNGDPDTECTRCFGVTCGTNAHCDEDDGDCVCDDGFGGDPDTLCTRCSGVICGTNAYCDESSGDCVCDDGYVGNPETECIDMCEGLLCGENAHCVDGVCICDDGYQGNPILGCTLIDPCADVTCGTDAYCSGGTCYCNNGYTGDPTDACIQVATCNEISCGANAHCVDDGGISCVCDENYEGDPIAGCALMDFCVGVDCITYSANSHCVVDLSEADKYLCVCDPGYQWDGVDGACGLLCADDDLEDNDDFASAVLITEFPFVKNDMVMMDDGNGTDEDYFVVALYQGQTVQVDVTFSDSVADIDLYVYHSGDLGLYDYIASSVTSDDNEQIIGTILDSGYYYLRITKYGSDPVCADYGLEIKLLENICETDNPCTGEHEVCNFLPGEDPNYECGCEPGYEMDPNTDECVTWCEDDEFEPNDASDEAAAVSLDFSEDGLAIFTDDDDWYTFTVDANTNIVADATFIDDDGDIDIYLYAAADIDSLIVGGSSFTDNENLEYFSAGGGVYFLKVRLWDFSDEGICQSYDLDITGTVLTNPCLADPSPCTDPHHVCNFLPGEDPDYECACEPGWKWDDDLDVCYEWCPDDTYEPNDDASAAEPLTTPFREAGLAIFSGDEDWYSFTADAGDVTLVEALFENANGDIELYLYHESDTSTYGYVASSASSSDDESLAYAVESSGVHYVRLKMYSSDKCSTYELGIYVGNDPCDSQCTGSDQDCVYAGEAPFFECVCINGAVWSEDGTECVADPCDGIDCGTLFSDNSHCELDWSEVDDYVCVCDEKYRLNQAGDACEFDCDDDGAEDNDTAVTATQVTLPYVNADLVSMREDDRDYDWFKFHLDQGDGVHILAEFIDDDGDIDIHLFDGPVSNESYDYIANSSSSSDNEEIYHLAEETGDYYLRVKPYGTLTCNPYDLTIELAADPCTDSPCTGDNEVCVWLIGEDPNFECLCEENYFRNESDVCVTPCAPTTCTGSNIECVASAWDTYTCECAEGYFPETDDPDPDCSNPCDDVNACPGANTECLPTAFDAFTCPCIENFFPVDSSDDCANPCAGDPCGGAPAICTGLAYDDYECSCEVGYEWDVDSQSCLPLGVSTESEPNDSSATADEIDLSDPPVDIYAAIDPEGDADWYSFTIDSPMALYVETYSIAPTRGDVDTKIWLYESSDTVNDVENNDDIDYSNEFSEFSYSVEEGATGLYYLKVAASDSYYPGPITGEYGLKINVMPIICEPDATRCDTGDQTVLEVCNEDGTEWEAVQCTNVCEVVSGDDGDYARCQPSGALETEPNDTPAEAEDLGSSFPVTFHGSINPTGDADWYMFTYTAPARVEDPEPTVVYTIETSPWSRADVDTRLDLYASGDTETSIEYDDDGGEDTYSLINYAGDPGTFYVKVYGWSWSLGEYLLTVDVNEIVCEPGETQCAGSDLETCNEIGTEWLSTECDLDCEVVNEVARCGVVGTAETEPNDTYGTAVGVSEFPALYNGTVAELEGEVYDEDWYQLNIPSPGRVVDDLLLVARTFDWASGGETLDVATTLYGSDGATDVAWGDDGDEDYTSVLFFPVDAGLVYYLKVEGEESYYDPDTGDYMLEMELETIICETGETRCAANRSGELETCNEMGTEWIPSDCPYGCSVVDETAMCNFSGCSLGVLETFDSEIPADWTVTNSAWWWTDGVSDATHYASYMTDGFVVADSDGSGGALDGYLNTAAYTVGDCININLSFDHYFDVFSSAAAAVEISVDGGGWTEVSSWDSNNSDPQDFDLTTLIGGGSAFQLRFYYSGDYDWGWAVDNFMLYGDQTM